MSVVPTTLTGTVAVLPCAVAVTVMVRFEGSLAGLKVAVAMPVASVVAFVTTRPPELAENATVTPCTRLLLASRTNALIVAVFDPSEGICGKLVKTLTAFELPLVPELTATTVVP